MRVEKILLSIIVAVTLHAPQCAYAAIVQNDVTSQEDGIDEASPSISSSVLEYQICNSSNADKQALLKIDIIGTGANQVPAGSTISSATLRLKAHVGGDGNLYRAAEPWSSSSTWNSVGDVMTIGSAVGVGLNTGQSQEFTVTSHVQAWANGSSNFGWVIKGVLDDCSAAEIYNGNDTSTNRPRLTVTYTPPDTTAPRVSNVTVASATTTYDVPSGSGEQMRTVPVANVSKVIVTFDEDVINTSTNISLKSAITNATYSGTVSYVSSTHKATLTLTNSITAPDKLILTVTNSVTDAAGNALDSEWTNPTTVTSTGTTSFPSGNGASGSSAGAFKFNFTVLPGDYSRNNVGDASDYILWRKWDGTTTGATFTMGDGDGDGDVDGSDYDIYRACDGIDYTTR